MEVSRESLLLVKLMDSSNEISWCRCSDSEACSITKPLNDMTVHLTVSIVIEWRGACPINIISIVHQTVKLIKLHEMLSNSLENGVQNRSNFTLFAEPIDNFCQIHYPSKSFKLLHSTRSFVIFGISKRFFNRFETIWLLKTGKRK